MSAKTEDERVLAANPNSTTKKKITCAKEDLSRSTSGTNCVREPEHLAYSSEPFSAALPHGVDSGAAAELDGCGLCLPPTTHLDKVVISITLRARTSQLMPALQLAPGSPLNGTISRFKRLFAPLSTTVVDSGLESRDTVDWRSIF
ncbi:hypothetical protein SDRG_15098 [Saprolegnia diclina VS20]|uniref:Uncharacterized protein n=1 Tax=Saprolegnia diclina (strain VS20) TaxID=1156394 RepID=T0PNU9_SAPDV|nr:hypothetical protein SDRG_15098 [Saprolegnia diclina VS20]EQC27089.1 hypothetical protein SDRG_15098 [Saprolegnia diclina VS20]|eukprot:XP_008619483.1 hypothetical protein SDRG_15098 [Saprolegnia diclina VS20]